jgi:predicted dehydrogenase
MLPDSPPLGVAVVGTGFGKAVHIPAFQHHPRTAVVAVYHRDLERARTLARDFQIPYASDRLADILSRGDVQAVSVATPPFLHYEMGMQVIEAGKHLLLEKPMTLRAGEVRDLYRRALHRGIVAVADFEFRFIPAWQRLAQSLAEGFAGQIRLIKVDWLVASRANPERPWNWYARKDKGGGVLGAVGSHAFDYIHWLFGEVRQLSAQLNCAIARRPDPLNSDRLKLVDAEDTALVTMELESGAPCQLAISSVTHAGRGHWLEIYGDRGTLVLGSDNLKDYVHGFRLWAAEAGKKLMEVEIPRELAFPQVFADGRLAPFIRVVDRWIEGIEAGQNLTPSLREGTYSQLLMDLTQQAHQQRHWIEVPNLDRFLRG